jgi:hypothetical protein
VTDLAAAFAAVVTYLDEHGDESSYGYGRTKNPHDFTPDPECCTPAEIENHRAACEAYDKGEPLPHQHQESNGAIYDAKTSEKIKDFCGSPWGIGTYTYRDPDIDHAIEVLRDVMTSHHLVDPDGAP